MNAQPIAYEAISDRGREAVYAADLRSHAEAACAAHGWRLVPIYATRDIVSELRDRAYSFKTPDTLCERAANEIERLRNVLARTGGEMMPRRRAFTLVEALVVVAILATLAGLLAPAVMAARDHAGREAEQTSLLETVSHDGHMWVLSWSAAGRAHATHFVHHPDCICRVGHAERDE